MSGGVLTGRAGSGHRTRRLILRWATCAGLGAGLLLGSGACARPGAPPGGPGDRLPPVVAEVEPDTFAVVDPGDRTLRVRFNERISETPSRGTLEDAVTVSPRTGEISVSHDRRGLDIEVDGGLRPGLVYRVALEPVLEDMFDNPMAVPFEWVFTTGGEVRPNAVYGQVWDATTGEPVEGAPVEVRSLEPAATDTFPYVATTDTLGIFTLRYLPTGALELRVWEDLNGDGSPELLEPSRTARLELGAVDTVPLPNLPLLAGDTTAAELVSAEILDSLTLRVEFDDFVDPVSPIDEVQASLAPATDSSGAVLEAAEGSTPPAVARLFHEAAFATWADSLAEATEEARQVEDVADPAEGETPDTALVDTVPPDAPPPDTVPPDTLPAAPGDTVSGGAVGDSATAEPEPAPRPREPTDFALEEALDLLPDGRPLPQRSFVIRLAEPLPRGVPFDLTVLGVINLGQRAGGGGVRRIELEPPPAEPAAPSGR